MEDQYTLDSLLNRHKENWPEAMTPESEVIICLMRLNDMMSEGFSKIMADYGFSPIAFEVLVTLRGCPPPHQLTPTDLYRSMFCTSGGMTKALKNLEEEGLVARIPHEQDKRSMLVQLTEQGIKRAEEVMRAVGQEDQRIFAGSLDRQDVVKLNDLLKPLITKLEEARKT